MKKRTIVLIIVASSLVAAGLIAATVGLCLADFEFTGLSTQKKVSDTIEISDAFKNISIVSDGDVSLQISDDGVCRVETTYYERNKTVAYVSDETLNVVKQDERKWFDHIGIAQIADTTVIYLPESQYVSLKSDGKTGDFTLGEGFFFESADIKTSTGDISMFHTSFSETLSLKRSTGKVELSDIRAKDIFVVGSTGDTMISDIVADDLSIESSTGRVSLLKIRATSLSAKTSTGAQSFSDAVFSGDIRIEADTGKVTFAACDAAKIYVTTDTGDVRGTLLSEKIFVARSDTGDINVPSGVNGGICEINTDTGDINISIE